MDDEELISYTKLREFSEQLAKDIVKVKEHAKALRAERTALVGTDDDTGVWEGKAATVFDTQFIRLFYDLYKVTDFLTKYKDRLAQKAADYEAADKVAMNIADSIEQANWAEV